MAVSRDRVGSGGSGWHRALVRRRGRRLYVRLDNREVFTAVVGNRTVEDLQQDVLETDGLLWIGEEDFYTALQRTSSANSKQILLFWELCGHPISTLMCL